MVELHMLDSSEVIVLNIGDFEGMAFDLGESFEVAKRWYMDYLKLSGSRKELFESILEDNDNDVWLAFNNIK